MSYLVIISCGLIYLLLLFGIAYYAEYKLKRNVNVVNNPWMYALSMAVYCTAWTYYGSVGRVGTQGMEFLGVYIGPTIACAFFYPVLRKILRICKSQRINSIADFIATRYGKNVSLGIIITIFCVLGLIPYISLQLKAITSSLSVLSGEHMAEGSLQYFYKDITFYITLILVCFIILFGTRSVDASEKHAGLVASIAFESIIKLVAFVMAGIFVTYGLFHGLGDIFQKAAARPDLKDLFVFGDHGTFSGWTATMLLSMFATLLLPRQFQVSVVENMQEQHLKKALWLFPVYLLIINLFVVPIALAGMLTPALKNVDSDSYVLALPLLYGHNKLGLFIFMGGFSAAISMIIVETIALSTMVSNHLLLPLLFSSAGSAKERPLLKSVINSRRVSIALLLLLAYVYERTIAQHASLVSIGLVSFAAVAQFAPALFIGLFWKAGNRRGAVASILAGFFIWFYTLALPAFITGTGGNSSIMTEGLFGISLLRPYALFGMEGLSPIAHSFFWSMLINVLTYVIVSVNTFSDAQELYQAELFVDIFRHTSSSEQNSIWKGTAYIRDIRSLLVNFLGEERADRLLTSFAIKHKLSIESGYADPRLVSFSERILSGVIGSASARIMVRSVTKEEIISIAEVLNIVKESQQVLELNKELRKKSAELTKATEMLTAMNEQLTQMDVIKDEFLYTVTHELRTPLTSIRAMSEIVYDNQDMEEEMRNHYLSSIVNETERLSHLITQVLNLERYESGRQKLHITPNNIDDLIAEVVHALQPLANEKKATLTFHPSSSMYLVQCDSDLIRQVIYNLISNAIKFVPGQTGMINIRVRIEYEELQVWIEDNGKGVPNELHELIFDKFFQAKNQTIQKPEGSGLGLAISKRIMDMHNGRIWVESEPGKGANFIFGLPYA
ncbi:histidine kinase [Flavipsychrobacter stenotrophus]|uniref:histidine kinase n=1 Tax=Flavipsychrobacter stenotrophus TaxID=2077091 RepID=A0A2S7SV30_9BACT|nr:sensor histidine kinase [Flavipsychrobacter stenotrophus]PQJ10465.1 histidine kinase [Flavipsychrobacter stenotrophus]